VCQGGSVRPLTMEPAHHREYVDRTYRASVQADDLTAFTVSIKQTDLYILAARDLTEEAARAARKARRTVEHWIERCPEFATALAPLPCPGDAPRIIRKMTAAGEAAGVGPMAAVAGAIAESVARDLSPLSPDVIVENGGDTYLMGAHDRLVGIFAGESPLSNAMALAIPSERQPIAVCTSSGTVGPSLSLGNADAVVVAGEDGALADAVATATGNRVQDAEGLSAAVRWASEVSGIRHVVAILGSQMAAWGDLELRRLG
jgi:ApbE superfamily uncharacterized protein (UPF0280 family)